MNRPTSRLRRTVELSANVAIIVVAALVIYSFVVAKFRAKQSVPVGPSVGMKMSLSGVKWEENGSTLLIALQRGCRFCEESAGFYHRLYEQRGQTLNPRIVAVVPGEKSEVERYLSDQGILADQVINLSLSELNVSGTPTLMLVDHEGRVNGVWVGKLNDNQEKEVSQKIVDRH